MIICSKCGELLEDGSEVCYLCKHRLTASERVKADRIAEEYKPVLAAMKEYKKRTKRGVTVLVVSFLLLLVMAYVFVGLEPSTGIQSAGFIIWFVAFIGGLVWSKFNCCPWCGRYQGKHSARSTVDGEYCRHCGKQLSLFDVDWEREQ